MSSLTLKTQGFSGDVTQLQQEVSAAHDLLTNKNGPGSEFTGWLNLPQNHDRSEVNAIKEAAKKIQSSSQALVVVGVGGSYIGSRAAIEMLSSSFYNQLPGNTAVYFAGHNLCSDYHNDLLDLLQDIDFSVNVISKSGTTLEPAIAFRLLRQLLENKYGVEGARERIFVTTDAHKGALRELADQKGYQSFVIPDVIGGRYSVLTPVGLLPMAVAGIDISRVMEGAAKAQREYSQPDLQANSCYHYAAIRNFLYREGKAGELFVGYQPSLHSFGEWWKQLFGESEGKDGKGLLPASVSFTTDLHSLGQYIQDGHRLLFATTLWSQHSSREVSVPPSKETLDGLDYLEGKTLHHVNAQAFGGTVQAHVAGGVPNVVLEVPGFDAETFGFVVYFFMKACAISGYLLGVNPFDQPGVETYKKNMFCLLGR